MALHSNITICSAGHISNVTRSGKCFFCAKQTTSDFEVLRRCENCQRIIPSAGCVHKPDGDGWEHAGPIVKYFLVVCS